MIVSKRTHNALIVKHTTLQAKYNAMVEQQRHVTEERNQIGALLLDCLSLLGSITISKRQNGLSVEKESLVERAKELSWLPGKTEEESEEVEHAN